MPLVGYKENSPLEKTKRTVARKVFYSEELIRELEKNHGLRINDVFKFDYALFYDDGSLVGLYRKTKDK